ncbi:hypothetical protein T8S45_01695 [Blastomonas marina]|uniref:hypothetical protein n=1 Tax=Blastomonas marina TaxID=1867408 RepID=UPI002AC9C9ED|nr:hypothetical protein [Blastomonas marina]WPZ04271.1 hypothetical protein T8S45_01695 [Blastomonas marina]
MRTVTGSLIVSLLLAGCSPEPTYEVTLETTDGPDPALVTQIEEQLSRDPCLSDIATMRREYRYGMRDGEEDRGLIDIKVQEADFDGLPAGIFIKGQSNFGMFDDRSYFVAFATYHLGRGELDIWACGDNANSAQSMRHKPRF